MAHELIRLDIADNVATITLNRPDRLNAAPPQMFNEMNAAITTFPDLGVRALMITGEGRAFCSGADIVGGGEEAMRRGPGMALEESYNPVMRTLAALPIPIVAAVNGAAAGIGCSLALTADFVIAARSAYFLQAFVNLGLVPDGGATWLLPRLVGKARAAEMMMLGERISAEKAESWGLIHRAVDDNVLMAEARALVVRLANGPSVALGLTRIGMWRALEQTHAQALSAEAHAQVVASKTADAREGLMAFHEKRPPRFEGR